MSESFELRSVSAETLRKMFNDAGFVERVENGELDQIVISSARPSPKSGQPPSTLSQEVAYYEQGVEVARVHQFVAPDGTILGSGLPDPKAILHEGVLYVLAPSKD